MPNRDTPPMIARVSHISGSWPVLTASGGPNCFTAGGFFRKLRAASVLVWGAHCGGSISLGHQFFGGSLKRKPQEPTITSIHRPTRTMIHEKFCLLNA